MIDFGTNSLVKAESVAINNVWCYSSVNCWEKAWFTELFITNRRKLKMGDSIRLDSDECIKILEEFLEHGIIRDEKGNFVRFVAPIYEALAPVLATYRALLKENGDLVE